MAPVCTIINTRGNAVPPVFVFPHVRINDALMINAPEKKSLSGTLTKKRQYDKSSTFKGVVPHQEKYYSKEGPILVLLDYHEALK
jgi:hypothetical protein